VLVPRFLQLVALVLVFMVSGAPAWIAELAEDDCAAKCADEEQDGCPDEGCGDCSVVCSSCPRSHVVLPSHVVRVAPGSLDFACLASEAGERVPDEPVPEGVFHPPRLAG
jgi:hypothetical protein